MPNDNVSVWDVASRVRPSAVADQNLIQPRAGRYGEQYVQAVGGAKLHALADEGSYWTAVNATPGTAIVGIAAADGYDVTETLFYLHVNAAATRRVYMDHIHLTCGAAGTNGTDFSLAITTDNTARYTSGGTQITPANALQGASDATATDRVQFGAIVSTAASTNGRLLWHGLMRTVIKVIGDQYTLVFGAPSQAPTANILAGTAQAHVIRHVPPLVLNPGDSLLIHEYAASQSVAASYQFAAGWWER